MLITDLLRVSKWVARRADADPEGAEAAIGWTRDGQITCGVFYEHFTHKSITATLAIEPGAVVPKEFLWAIFDYPFNRIRVWKVIAYVAENNTRSRTAVEKMGFVFETSIADYYPEGALLVYSMVKPDCRWLEMKNGKE